MTSLFSQQIARSFSRASNSYINAARLQQQVAADALQYLPSSADTLIDLGCGPGWLHPQLSERCQQLLAVDLSAGMLQQAATLKYASRYIQADAAALPLPDQCSDSVFSSLMLQWCPQPAAVLQEICRVLKPGGQAVVTTLVQGTLAELESAFAALDDKPHIHQFLTAAQLQACTAMPAMEWQCQLIPYTLYYPDVFALLKELKALGANQLAGRRQGLTGRVYWQQFAEQYEQFRTSAGVAARYQVMLLHGMKKG